MKLKSDVAAFVVFMLVTGLGLGYTGYQVATHRQPAPRPDLGDVEPLAPITDAAAVQGVDLEPIVSDGFYMVWVEDGPHRRVLGAVRAVYESRELGPGSYHYAEWTGDWCSPYDEWEFNGPHYRAKPAADMVAQGEYCQKWAYFWDWWSFGSGRRGWSWKLDEAVASVQGGK